MYEFIPDNPYLLLTPGPLSSSKSVRNALLRDWCTWDADYNENIVQNIRRRLVKMASAKKTDDYTVILMQGSGSFSVEAVLGTTVPQDGKVLILTNGAYGERMVKMAKVLKLNHVVYPCPETAAPDPEIVSLSIDNNPDITHVAFVHCETTTGMLNPLPELSRVVKQRDKVLIVDAMSSFGGIPIDMADYGIDYLISSSNKCVQGVPGFAFTVAKRAEFARCEGNARSLCLDLYDQWKGMDGSGKWRYTSPTHIVRAFYQAMDELESEGGVEARFRRYSENQRILVEGMAEIGFKALLPKELQSPIITSFLYPDPKFCFKTFYEAVKKRGFVLYPGKISQADTFRIGNIGEVYPYDIRKLLEVIKECR
ncbi:MAG: 2-aminoethylphosphonate--pyruvate transaminase [Chitinispirillia bacterium]|nr:2-aminoethylphosphonate--pyruvate transaminase [Chitinispirillia bacterium]MCL2269070.1 2-aminoethylphosphonate--pyruvate transaminase [Chitinispirillia bacterium]